jgi:O-antigen ligase
MAGAIWWLWHRLARNAAVPDQPQPVRRAMLVFVFAVLASFVAASSRPIAAYELRSAQLGILVVLSWLGVLLVAHDGPLTRERLDAVLSRVAFGAGLVAILGIAQFATGQPLTNYIEVPGLTLNNELVSLGTRDGFNRPAGTALHPIEFGVAITMLLPICLHFAMHGRGAMAVRWFPVAAIAFAIPISVSRSAVVCAAVSLMILLPTWPREARRLAALALSALLVVVFVTIPGMLGTLTGLFLGVSTDTSARSRTDSYDLAWDFVSRAPVFGRGFSTFLPSYRILDNQYLGLLIDAGLIGLLSFLGALVTGILCMFAVRRRSAEPVQRHLAQALAASLASAGTAYALFDGFSFPLFAGLTFLVLGCAGCMWRLHVQSCSLRPSREEDSHRGAVIVHGSGSPRSSKPPPRTSQ